jgi:hypothetical protein
MNAAPSSTRANPVIFVLLWALTACNSGPDGPAPIGPRLELTGPQTIAPGESQAYRLIAKSAGGGDRDVSLEAEWRSSSQEAITIAGPGRAAAQQPGEAVITAIFEGQSATISVFVVPPGTFALKGAVKEPLTNLPVAGAAVQVLVDGAVELETATAIDGRYQLYGFAPGSTLRVSKDGYLDNQQPLEVADHRVGLDVVLRRPGVPDTYTGLYTLTLDVVGECSAIPEAAKRRTFTASIESFEDPRLTADYVVTLSDATFASSCGTNALAPGLLCNQFFAQNDGGAFSVNMSDYEWGEGGQITERLADGTWLYVTAFVSGRFEGSTLDTSGSGDVTHCPASQPSPWGCQTITRSCRTDFRLRFTMRP